MFKGSAESIPSRVDIESSSVEVVLSKRLGQPRRYLLQRNNILSRVICILRIS
jgi:hypothetical protein